MRTIHVIDPAVEKLELTSYNFLNTLCPPNVRLHYHAPALFGFDSFCSIKKKSAGVIIFGSKASAHEESDWQKSLESVLKAQARKKIPILGICFGHQYLIKIFCGSVDFISKDRTLQTGKRKLSRVQNDPLLPKISNPTISVRHAEMVTSIPNSFKILMSSAFHPFEVLRHNNLPIWTIQGHPEVQYGFLKNLGLRDSKKHYAFGHELLRRFLTLRIAK